MAAALILTISVAEIVVVIVVVVVCLFVCSVVNRHGRSQLKTSGKYRAVSTWSIDMAKSDGGTSTKFLLLGVSSSPQRGHVESTPWTLFQVSPSSREQPLLS
jgi:hypothetical protein